MHQMVVTPPRQIRGYIEIPGDKSISHRAILLNSIATGNAQISNFLTGADCLSTIACLQALGVSIEREDNRVSIQGVGFGGFREPTDILDCGNSGTTLRLLTGLLAGYPFFSILSGDASLRTRPQRRIVEPLRALGAHIDGRNDASHAPLAVRGGHIRGGHYELPIPSAQVKSALLLAALASDTPLRLSGRIDSRDHTERMLQAMGATLTYDDTSLTMSPMSSLRPLSLDVPGDPSSAAFWWVAAAIHPDADLTTTGVCLNPTRTGALDVLRAMGADITIHNERLTGSEPVGDVRVRSSSLRATDIGGPLIPRLIDEIPVLAVAAACAHGTTSITDAQELRVKESDRITTVVTSLHALGVQADATPDGMHIVGRGGQFPNTKITLETYGDHRLAMAWAIAALASPTAITIAHADVVDVSYPTFWKTLASIQA